MNVVNFSGGKDSTAMLLRMIELGMDIDEIVFADTGLEFPELYEYIKKVENYIGRKVNFVKGENNWDSWFYGIFTRGKYKGRRRGFPYVIQRCWANRELKAKPLDKFNKGNTIYVGIAYDEKHRLNRKMYKENDFRFPLVEWKWTEKDCLKYLKEKNMENPLYEKFDRLGCWLCPKQPIKNLRIIYDDYPDLWKKILQYEKDSPHGFKPNISIKDLDRGWKNEKT